MTSCELCVTASDVYDDKCAQCALRRVARYPGVVAGRVLERFAKDKGQEAADALRYARAGERKRLMEAGQL